MERITGPCKGYYIAARARQIGSVWMGEARVFAKRPSAFDDQSSVATLAGDQSNAPSELDAIENAERVARDWISNSQRLYEQFELAKPVYAWHQLLAAMTEPNDRAFVAQKIQEAAMRFVDKGGVVKTGVGPLGDKGPALETSDGKAVPYSAGNALVAQYAEVMRSR